VEKKRKWEFGVKGLGSKCGAAETRIEKTMYKELFGEGRFP